MTKKILIIQPLRPEAFRLLDSRKDITYEFITDFSLPNLLKHIGDADGITIRDAPLSVEVLENAPKLKVISRHGVGFDNIPVDYCTKRKILVTVVGAVNSVSVAEQTMFLMLAAAKSGILLDQAVRRGDFAARSRVLGIELLGLTLFIVGFGRIGQLVAARARAFGLRILAFDPYVDGNQFSGVSFVESPEEGLPQANFLSLHVPLLPETRHLIGARQLDLLPEGAIVLNLARGGLIDESALLRRVQTGRLYGAGLDTFEKEPLPAGASIATEERIVLSPHSAALTENSLIAMGVVTVQNVLAGLDGSIDPELVVNKAILPEKGNVKL
jgi:D-3-phosphoglycerate dehydrogenase